MKKELFSKCIVTGLEFIACLCMLYIAGWMCFYV